MKKIIILVFITFFSLHALAQNRKFRAPIWTVHDKNTDIAGVSLGFLPTDFKSKDHVTKTFGVRIEAFPLSFFYFLAPRVPTITSVTQKIYGVNISSGTFEGIDAHGISATLFMNNMKHMNGISIAGISNTIENANGLIIGVGGNGIENANGVMIGGIFGNYTGNFKGLQISTENRTKNFTGIQIGIFNKAEKLKGIQLGIWNKNQKRALPILNWNFKS